MDPGATAPRERGGADEIRFSRSKSLVYTAIPAAAYLFAETATTLWHVDDRVERYDLGADPEEKEAIAGRDPGSRDRLRADLEAWMASLAGPESIRPFQGGDE